MTMISVRVLIDSPMRQPRDKVITDLAGRPGWTMMSESKTARIWTIEYAVNVTEWRRDHAKATLGLTGGMYGAGLHRRKKISPNDKGRGGGNRSRGDNQRS